MHPIAWKKNSKKFASKEVLRRLPTEPHAPSTRYVRLHFFR